MRLMFLFVPALYRAGGFKVTSRDGDEGKSSCFSILVNFSNRPKLVTKQLVCQLIFVSGGGGHLKQCIYIAKESNVEQKLLEAHYLAAWVCVMLPMNVCLSFGGQTA